MWIECTTPCCACFCLYRCIALPPSTLPSPATFHDTAALVTLCSVLAARCTFITVHIVRYPTSIPHIHLSCSLLAPTVALPLRLSSRLLLSVSSDLDRMTAATS